jgi:hypothetical protein
MAEEYTMMLLLLLLVMTMVVTMMMMIPVKMMPLAVVVMLLLLLLLMLVMTKLITLTIIVIRAVALQHTTTDAGIARTVEIECGSLFPRYVHAKLGSPSELLVSNSSAFGHRHSSQLSSHGCPSAQSDVIFSLHTRCCPTAYFNRWKLFLAI